MKKPKRLNSFTISLIIFAIIMAYLGYAFIPIYWPLIRMKGIQRSTCAFAAQEYDDQVIMKRHLKDVKRTGLNLSKDNFLFERVSYSDEEFEAMKTEALRDWGRKRGKTCRFHFSYANTYLLPLLDIEWKVDWNPSPLEQSLEAQSYDDIGINVDCTCARLEAR